MTDPETGTPPLTPAGTMTPPVKIHPVNAAAFPHPMATHMKAGAPRRTRDSLVVDRLHEAAVLHPDRITLIRWSRLPDASSTQGAYAHDAGARDAELDLWSKPAPAEMILRAWGGCRATLKLDTLLFRHWLGVICSDVCLFLPLDAQVALEDAEALKKHIQVPDFGAETDRIRSWTDCAPNAVPLACAPLFLPFSSRHAEMGWTGNLRSRTRHILSSIADPGKMIVP